jgi:hypothetical protein
MLCSNATYPSGVQVPPPSTNSEPIYATNGANANKSMIYPLNYSLEFIVSVFLRLLDTVQHLRGTGLYISNQ